MTREPLLIAVKVCAVDVTIVNDRVPHMASGLFAAGPVARGLT